jgi:LAO/AO transport system kinase
MTDKDLTRRPEWAPEEANPAFTSRVMKGKTTPEEIPLHHTDPAVKRRKLSSQQYVEGILSGDLTVLARAITLVESQSVKHRLQAQEVLKELLPHTEKSIRVGITGVPGVGKSTFIETLGCTLCDMNRKVAVLAVDPSSRVSGGSILGDKTRMEKLSRRPNAFIRPSPSGQTLGGVTCKSRETILLCEAFGFDTILVETVGVGQNETTVRSMVDFFLLLMLPGAGDELQGIKKGIMELADALLINKADGDNKQRAEAARQEYSRALHYLMPATVGHYTDAWTCSALTGEGISEFWNVVEEFSQKMQKSGIFQERRRFQRLEWVNSMIEDQLKQQFHQHPAVKSRINSVMNQVSDGSITATQASELLLSAFHNSAAITE